MTSLFPAPFIRLALIFALLLSASLASAACRGTDLRQRLTPKYEAQLHSEIARTPFAYGNHWVARKASRTINVVGTQHFGDSRMGAVMRELKPAISQADAVLLEVTSAEMDKFWDDVRADPSNMLITSGPLIHQMLSAEDWRRLQIALSDTNLSEAQAARMQPWLLSFYLSRSSCGGRGLGPSAGLDDRIERFAVRKRIPIGGLETSGAGVKLLARQPMRDQLKLLQLDLRSGLNYDDQALTMSNAYFEEALAEAIIVQQWTLYRDLDVPRSEVARLLRQFETLIIDRRNQAWIPIIERTPGDRLFVAVGAAHLPGKLGVLNLLKAKGYTLERAAF